MADSSRGGFRPIANDDVRCAAAVLVWGGGVLSTFITSQPRPPAPPPASPSPAAPPAPSQPSEPPASAARCAPGTPVQTTVAERRSKAIGQRERREAHLVGPDRRRAARPGIDVAGSVAARLASNEERRHRMLLRVAEAEASIQVADGVGGAAVARGVVARAVQEICAAASLGRGRRRKGAAALTAVVDRD